MHTLTIELTPEAAAKLDEVSNNLNQEAGKLVGNWLSERLEDDPYGAKALAEATYWNEDGDFQTSDKGVLDDVRAAVTTGAAFHTVARLQGDDLPESVMQSVIQESNSLVLEGADYEHVRDHAVNLGETIYKFINE